MFSFFYFSNLKKINKNGIEGSDRGGGVDEVGYVGRQPFPHPQSRKQCIDFGLTYCIESDRCQCAPGARAGKKKRQLQAERTSAFIIFFFFEKTGWMVDRPRFLRTYLALCGHCPIHSSVHFSSHSHSSRLSFSFLTSFYSLSINSLPSIPLFPSITLPTLLGGT